MRVSDAGNRTIISRITRLTGRRSDGGRDRRIRRDAREEDKHEVKTKRERKREKKTCV